MSDTYVIGDRVQYIGQTTPNLCMRIGTVKSIGSVNSCNVLWDKPFIDNYGQKRIEYNAVNHNLRPYNEHIDSEPLPVPAFCELI